MTTIKTTFDTFFATLSAVIMSAIKHLGKFVVPVPPAWFWGSIIAETSGNVYVGISAAIVLEIGGMLSAYYAIAYYGTGKGKLAAWLTAAYLLIGIGVMWLLDSASRDEKTVITATFIIAGMVYVLSGMAELEAQEMTANASNLAWERGEAEKDNDLKRQLRLQAQADKTAVKLAELQAQPAQVAPQLDNHPLSIDDLTPAQRRVYDAIKAQPQATYTEIGKALGISRQAVSDHVQKINGVMEK